MESSIVTHSTTGNFFSIDFDTPGTWVTVTPLGTKPLKQGLEVDEAIGAGPGFLLIAIGEAFDEADGPGFLLMAMGETATLGGPLAIAVIGLFLTPEMVVRGTFLMLTIGDIEVLTESPTLLNWPAFCISVSC